MPSLRQLLDTHPSLLLLDTASNRIQVGLLSRHHETRWATADTEAGTGLFTCLEQLALNPMDVAATLFCAGPGSILGIRTAAMAIRSWNVISPRPTYSYHSLALVASALSNPEATIIADARREQWHCQREGHPIQQIAADQLTGKLFIPEGFRHWSVLPEDTSTTSYDLEKLIPQVIEAPLFTMTDSPEAYQHNSPSYKEWTPKIHRMP